MSTSPSIQRAVDDAFQAFGQLPGGANADYIPFLAQVPDKLSALAVVGIDGSQYCAGDVHYRFAIESISKVCTLALALEDWGHDTVQEKIGADATGLPFNSIMALELHAGKPLSPLVNAGAIATASLVKAGSVEERWQRILAIQQQLGSGEIALSAELNESEQSTNAHNRAIAWLLHSAGYMYCDPMEACDVYTRQCSTLLDCLELATIGATLASGGIHPFSGKRILQAENTPRILADMTMEGLYDSSGDWAYTVGLPGKSGVGGGLLAVVPGVLAIAAFSPPLDEFGNSVRGQKMIAAVADTLGYNIYRSPATALPPSR
ncbi:glutaminase A [Kerstersia similis]|uniref:glutaminase A n=1 Tax=Kerstersia similis TaxID=206505 RepID=UPI0039F040D1